MRTRKISVDAPGDLEGVGSLKGFFEMVVELFIGEVSRLNTTSNQVRSCLWLRLEVVDQCPESASDTVSLYRISDLPANRVRHID